MEPIARVYPTPPPTTNNLTSKQRSLLLRKAKKIEQILGCPPHMIDTLYKGTTTSSPPFTGRSSAKSSPSTQAYLDSSENKDNVSWFCYGSRNLATAKHDNGLSQIPLLRAASKSLRLELVAVTNLPAKPSVTMSPETPKSYAPSFPDSELPLKSPTFTIPTSHTHRKAKMDRIRKRLGSEVPCEVVFPEDVDQDSGNSVGRKWSNSEKLTPRRKDAVVKPSPTLSNPSRRHSERRRSIVVKVTSERLSFIPECPDESSGECRELTVDFMRTLDGSAAHRSTTCSENSDGCGQGAVTLKHSRSYRKPPPPMLDDSLCSF